MELDPETVKGLSLLSGAFKDDASCVKFLDASFGAISQDQPAPGVVLHSSATFPNPCQHVFFHSDVSGVSVISAKQAFAAVSTVVLEAARSNVDSQQLK